MPGCRAVPDRVRCDVPFRQAAVGEPGRRGEEGIEQCEPPGRRSAPAWGSMDGWKRRLHYAASVSGEASRSVVEGRDTSGELIAFSLTRG